MEKQLINALERFNGEEETQVQLHENVRTMTYMDKLSVQRKIGRDMIDDIELEFKYILLEDTYDEEKSSFMIREDSIEDYGVREDEIDLIMMNGNIVRIADVGV